jgi:hypothetical protein
LAAVVEHGDSLFLVLEHLAGETLADRPRKVAPAIGQSLGAIAGLVRASPAHRL